MRARHLVLLAAVLASPEAPAADEPEPMYKHRPLEYWFARFEAAEKDEDRAEPAEALKAFGADAAPAVPKLVEMLDDRSGQFRRLVADVLKGMGPGAKGAIPELGRQLKESKARDPELVLYLLGEFGTDAVEAVPAIIPMLKHPNEWNRVEAFRAICAIRPPGEKVIPDLCEAVRSHRKGTGTLPGSYYVASRELRPHALIFDTNALFSLRESFGPAAAPLLVELFECEGRELRIYAAKELAVIGPPAKPVAPGFAAGLKDKDPGVRIEVARALWRIEKNPAAIAVLTGLLNAPPTPEPRPTAVAAPDPTSAPARKALAPSTIPAAEVLGEIGPAAAGAVPALEQLLQDASPVEREVFETAIRRIKSGPKPNK